jgi:hypothetical protein
MQTRAIINNWSDQLSLEVSMNRSVERPLADLSIAQNSDVAWVN